MNTQNTAINANGIYVRGIVVSNRAKALKKKDGSGIAVIVESELALQPGMITWSRFMDPSKDEGLKLNGLEVLEYPQLPEFQPVTIRATKIKCNETTGSMTIAQGTVVASS